jgi:S-adenosylmethionine-diacylglycerol 3-amino-3-carboxypropyl transferase
LKPRTGLGDQLNQGLFNALYQRSLVYNACWEDPAVDREALRIRPDDRMLVITSAGCNVLDYALCGPSRIHAVDANPRQTALLELKLAGIRRLQHDDFFGLFGRGAHPRANEIYRDALRDGLSDFARGYWDKRVDWFGRGHRGDTFYYFGLSGLVARAFRGYLRMRPRLRSGIYSLYQAGDLEEQRARYDADVAPYLWGRAVNWAISRPITMSLLGVPHPQREEVERSHQGGIAGFVREAIEYVFRHLPVGDNYFWSVYVHGAYTPECCPEYLKRDNFYALKDGLVDCVRPSTCMVTEFLQKTDEPISRFVLLDHMDWMSVYHPQALVEEWEAIMARATSDARLIFRSAHSQPDYLDRIQVPSRGRSLRELLGFEPDLAARLHMSDRVHTYAGFHIAQVLG